MTCVRWERELALLAGDDLPEGQARALMEHLQSCPSCQEALGALREDRQGLALLRSEPLSSDALAHVRSRVLDRIESGTPLRALAWRWVPLLVGMAAVVMVALLVSRAPRESGRNRVATVSRGESPATSASRAGGSRPEASSPAPQPPPARPRVERQPAAPERHAAPASARPRLADRDVESQNTQSRLSPEDADQLARAVLLVSQVKRLSDWPPRTPDPPADHGLIKLATDDPNIVVYWQIDSNGGES